MIEEMLHQATDRAVEERVDKTVEQQAFGPGCFGDGAIDMLDLALVPQQEPFFRHDLHQLEGGGILDFALVLIQPVVDEAHGIGAVLPEDLQDLQFGFGRFGKRGSFPFAFHPPKVGIFSYAGWELISALHFGSWRTGKLQELAIKQYFDAS
jgi:hypothetical protein